MNYSERMKLLRHHGALWRCIEAERSGVKRSGTHGVVTGASKHRGKLAKLSSHA